MPIPIVTIPDKGKIATRPRRQSIWDTEGDPSGSAIPTKLTFHRSYTAFQATGLTLSKVKGRDTSQEGSPGQLPTGDVFHWYSMILPSFLRNEGFLNPIVPGASAAANITARVTLTQLKRLRTCRAFVFRFSNTPYIQGQQDELPAGAGVIEASAAGNSTGVTALNVYASGSSISSSRAERVGRYDITIDGFPTTITEQENFALDLIADSGLVPTPSLDVYHTLFLLGTYLQGIRG